MAALPTTRHSLHYREALKSPVLPERTLRAAYATGALDVLRVLAERLDTPDDIAHELATHARPEIRAAAAKRAATLNPAEALTGERRTEVLVRALAASDVTGAVIRAALEAFMRRPTRALESKLSRLDPDVFTPEQAAMLLKTMRPGDHGGQGSWIVSRLAGRLASPALALPFFEDPNCAWLCPELMRRLDDIDDTIAALSSCVTTGAIPLSWFSSTATSAFRNFQPEVAKRIYAEVAPLIAERRPPLQTAFAFALASALDEGPWPSGRAWDTRPVTLPPDSRPLDEQDSSTLAKLATAHDSNFLHDVVTAAIDTGSITTVCVVATVALRSPYLTAPDRLALLRSLEEADEVDRQVFAMAWTDLKDVDVISAAAGDVTAIRAWAELFPAEVLKRHGWEPFGGIEAAPATLTRWQNTQPAERLRGVLENLALTAPPVELLRALTLPNLKVVCNSPGGEAIRDLHLRHIDDELGDDPVAWIAFDSITPESTNSLGEILDALKGITG